MNWTIQFLPALSFSGQFCLGLIPKFLVVVICKNILILYSMQLILHTPLTENPTTEVSHDKPATQKMQ